MIPYVHSNGKLTYIKQPPSFKRHFTPVPWWAAGYRFNCIFADKFPSLEKWCRFIFSDTRFYILYVGWKTDSCAWALQHFTPAKNWKHISQLAITSSVCMAIFLEESLVGLMAAELTRLDFVQFWNNIYMQVRNTTSKLMTKTFYSHNISQQTCGHWHSSVVGKVIFLHRKELENDLGNNSDKAMTILLFLLKQKRLE